jgi:hypothetical protein
MRSGEIDRHSPCALSGSSQRQTVDDLLPLLKWESRSSSPIKDSSLAPDRDAISRSYAAVSFPPDLDQSERRPLRAGWICFGLGLAIAWIFPLAHVFYSVAMILSVVAMCRLPARHGITLLICSFLGIGISLAISLAVGVRFIAALATTLRPPAAAASLRSQIPNLSVSPVQGQHFAPGLPRSIDSTHLPITKTAGLRTSTTTARTASSGTTTRPGAATPLPLPAEEITIQLGEWQTVRTRYGSLTVKIIDHGPATFSVWVGGEQSPQRLDKIKGFETTGTNLTRITTLPGANVYYIDRISVSPGYCVLKVVSRS